MAGRDAGCSRHDWAETVADRAVSVHAADLLRGSRVRPMLHDRPTPTRVPMNDFWLDRPTFVTGATGLVGSWVVRRLPGRKSHVICVVRDCAPESEAHAAGPLAASVP